MFTENITIKMWVLNLKDRSNSDTYIGLYLFRPYKKNLSEKNSDPNWNRMSFKCFRTRRLFWQIFTFLSIYRVKPEQQYLNKYNGHEPLPNLSCPYISIYTTYVSFTCGWLSTLSQVLLTGLPTNKYSSYSSTTGF